MLDEEKEIRYNKFLKGLISLREGEEWCGKCHGDGVVICKRDSGMFRKGHPLTCNECMGDGTVDWVEKATGKKHNVIHTNAGTYVGKLKA